MFEELLAVKKRNKNKAIWNKSLAVKGKKRTIRRGWVNKKLLVGIGGELEVSIDIRYGKN